MIKKLMETKLEDFSFEDTTKYLDLFKEAYIEYDPYFSNVIKSIDLIKEGKKPGLKEVNEIEHLLTMHDFKKILSLKLSTNFKGEKPKGLESKYNIIFEKILGELRFSINNKIKDQGINDYIQGLKDYTDSLLDVPVIEEFEIIDENEK